MLVYLVTTRLQCIVVEFSSFGHSLIVNPILQDFYCSDFFLDTMYQSVLGTLPHTFKSKWHTNPSYLAYCPQYYH